MTASDLDGKTVASSPDDLLRVVGLKTTISLKQGTIKAVDGVSFTVRRGESVGLVGESGSGKTMTCMSIVGLLPVSAAQIVAGEIWFEGTNLLRLNRSEMSDIRGRKIAVIMQDPLAALNPVLKVGDQVAEPIKHHLRVSAKSARSMAITMLNAVRIPEPGKRVNNYPHQFSGGMRQRIVAAMGLGTSPALLIADEPTTSLDVTSQAEFLTLIRNLQTEKGLAMLWVTHDLGVVAQTCNRVNVMYAGRIVESGDVRRVFSAPQHPYTTALLESVPRIGSKQKRLYQISGQPPDLLNLPPGCPFFKRCPIRMEVCRDNYPPTTPVGDEGFVECWARA